jgi:hypothetical protein
MDRARYATGQEEDQFPFGTDQPLGNVYEEPAQPQRREVYVPSWENDYGEPCRYDSVDEEAGENRL